MARRQMGQLDTPAGEKWPAADKERVGTLARNGHEGFVDFTTGARVEDLDLQSHGAGSRFHISQIGRGNCRFGWIEKHGHTRGCAELASTEVRGAGAGLLHRGFSHELGLGEPGKPTSQPD